MKSADRVWWNGFSRALAGCAVAVVTAGCGAANALGSNDEVGGEARRPSALGAFADGINVSRVDGLEAAHESQSAAAVLGERVFVAYRADDPDFIGYARAAGRAESQRVCWGASQLAVSVGHPASGFERARVAPPAGMGVLWGPVAVTRFRDRVLASALGSPEAAFAERADADGCVTLSPDAGAGTPSSLEASGALTAACLVPLTGGPASCVTKPGAALEGGSLAATERNVYAAYRDVTSGQVVLFRSANGVDFAELPVATSGADGAVLLAASGARLFVVYAAGAELRLLRYDEGGRTWEPPLVVTGRFDRRRVPSRKARPELSIQGFTIGLLEGERPELAVFFQRRLRGGRTSLEGALCETAPGGACVTPRHLRVAKSRDNFLPSIVSLARRTPEGGLEYRHLVSYWRDTRTLSGRVGLHVAEFDARRLRSRWRTLQTQRPCAMLHPDGADWGRADASFVLGQGTSEPRVYRAFTDSSSGACDARTYRATPQHVSVMRLEPLTPGR